MKTSSEKRNSDSLPEVERELVVEAANGLHVRPVSMVVEVAQRFRSERSLFAEPNGLVLAAHIAEGIIYYYLLHSK